MKNATATSHGRRRLLATECPGKGAGPFGKPGGIGVPDEIELIVP
jgi:hypothetical protein